MRRLVLLITMAVVLLQNSIQAEGFQGPPRLAGEGIVQELDEAIRVGDLRRVKEIIGKHPDLIRLKADGFMEITPFDLAKEKDHFDVFEYLSDVKNKLELLGMAAHMGDVQKADELLAGGAIPEVRAILEAITGNQSEMVEFLISNGCPVNPAANKMTSPLHVAVDRHKVEMVEYLLAHGAKSNQQDEMGATPLHIAVDHGSIDLAMVLVENGVDIWVLDNHGETPLHIAMISGNSKLEEYLSAKLGPISDEWKAKLNLHTAALMGYEDVFSRILDGALDKNPKDWRGNTALYYAVARGRETVIKAILEKGWLVPLQENDYASIYIMAASLGNVQVLDMLQKRHAELFENELNEFHKNTILVYAAENEDKEMVEYLLEKGVNIDAEDNYRRTALHAALLNGDREMVDLLISKGAGVTKESVGYLTSLHYAVEGGSIPLVEMLLGNKGLVQKADANGNWPLHIAAEKGFKEIVEILISSGADPDVLNDDGDTPLHLAAKSGNKELVELILSHGVDVNKVNRKGLTPLLSAARAGDKEIFDLLLARGANPDLVSEKGMVVLENLCDYHNSPGLLQLQLDCLLPHGFDVNRKAVDGYSIFSISILSSCDNESLETLLQYGADINTVTDDGFTPLHFVVSDIPYGSDKRTVQFLLEHGADVNARTTDGRTPLDLAENGVIQSVLIENGARYGRDLD